MPEVVIDKLIHGGQGLGTLADGRKVLVWNALPGERVRARITKHKKSYAEAIAEHIIDAAPERVAPEETNYLATSPWQIINFAAENGYKKDITGELFQQAGVALPDFVIAHDKQPWHYRNKMEYSFFGDQDGLHLALHSRGSHQKHIVSGSQLARPEVDTAASAVLHQLRASNVRAGDLKSLVVRSSQAGSSVALFVRPRQFPQLTLPAELRGLRVYHSNPKSPASLPTRLLQEAVSGQLADRLLGQLFNYEVESFFQINLPVFELALKRIAEQLSGQPLVDIYAGVGSIGLSVGGAVKLVELDPANAAMARANAARINPAAIVIESSTEKALEHITSAEPVIFDPPRAGLHRRVVDHLLAVRPPQIIYLSCNPATQARDLAALQAEYKISHFELFNFFPRTPHIESLAVMMKR